VFLFSNKTTGFFFFLCVFLHVAEYLGLPSVPYFGGSMKSFKEAGVNFSVAGATALDTAFLQERGIMNKPTNSSLDVQLGLFKLPALSFGKSSISSYRWLRFP
jgi:hypothetical protein